MSIVAVTSSRTSPGATTLAAGLSIAWSHLAEQSLLIEADPAGGVLALRFDLAPAPSLTSFGSDIRNGFSQAMLWANTQELRGVRCIPAPVDPVLARSWVERVTPSLVQELPHLGVPVVIDLGWVDENGASAKLASAADTTLIVTRPDIAEVQALLFQVRRLQALETNVAIVCVGSGPNEPAEIARIAGVPLAAVLPDDPKVAPALCGAKFNPGKFKRSMLWRTIGGLANSLLDEATMHARKRDGVAGSQPHEESSGPAAPAPLPPSPDSVAAVLSEPTPTPAPVYTPQPVSDPVRVYTPQPASDPVRVYTPQPASDPVRVASPTPAPGTSVPPGDISVTPTVAPEPCPATVIQLGNPSTPDPGAGELQPAQVVSIDAALFEDTTRLPTGIAGATLTLPNGERKHLYPMSDEITIGRHSQCDIVLRGNQVSRCHGRLVHTPAGWHYTDLGSRNGSEINGQPCTDAVLHSTDTLTIGQAALTFHTTSQREMECA